MVCLPNSDLEGFILAGGASSRMGADKAHLRLGGATLVGRAAAALGGVAARVSVVSSKPDAGLFGLPVVPDLFAGRGALGGLHAALSQAAAGWAAILSCDLPFATAALFERLASLRAPHTDAVAPLQPDGRPQPLCALYARAACLPVTEQLLAADELRPRALLSRVRTRWVPFAELADLENSEHFFRNVNTPEDFAEAQRVVSSCEL
ncbi:MAG TPA: molybdenum cofactor guanylyltransferase [Pyrinomonadaceae bacterium]|nr:molybdenum cofactor guanylyltransferase [Pyrinomonadaceae bacterium]